MGTTSFRLAIADDHPLFRGALREAVTRQFPQVELFEAGGFEDLQALLERESEIDLVLLDLTMPGVRGFSGLMYLRAQYPAIPVVVVSANEEAGVIRHCMEFGAAGFIPKTAAVETMRDAIAAVLEGPTHPDGHVVVLLPTPDDAGLRRVAAGIARELHASVHGFTFALGHARLANDPVDLYLARDEAVPAAH